MGCLVSGAARCWTVRILPLLWIGSLNSERIVRSNVDPASCQRIGCLRPIADFTPSSVSKERVREFVGNHVESKASTKKRGNKEMGSGLFAARLGGG